MKTSVLLISIICSISIFIGCSKDDDNDDIAPLTVSITNPAESDTVSAILLIRAESDSAPEFLEFFFDTFDVLSDNTMPYEAQFNVASYTTGAYSAYAIAHRGDETKSDTVHFYIQSAGNYWVTITQPLEGDSVSGDFTLHAEAGSGIEYIEFQFDTMPAVIDSVTNYETSYNVTLYSVGEYYAIATAHFGDSVAVDTVHFYTTLASTGYYPVLVEDFTNVNCVPCANVAAALGDVEEHYSSLAKPVVIEFHPNVFPGDPFYLASPTIHLRQFNFYALSSIPKLLLDGELFNTPDDPDAILTRLEQIRTTAKQATIQGYTYSSGDSIVIEGVVRTQSALIGQLSCYITRREFDFSIAPGDNDLTDFHFVASELMGEQALSGIMEFYFRYSVERPREILGGENTGYTIIAFIQNQSSHQVLGVNAFEAE